jgi:hypothetical protein
MGFRLRLFVKFGILSAILSTVWIFWLKLQSRGTAAGGNEPLEQERIIRGENLALTLAHYNLEPLLFEDDISMEANLIKAVSENPDVIYMVILSEDGSTLARDGGDQPEGLNPLNEEEKLIQKVSAEDGKELFDIRVPIKVGDTKKGEVHLGILAPEITAQGEVNTSFMIPIVILGAGIVFVFLLSMTTKPPAGEFAYDQSLAGIEEEEALAKRISQLKEDESKYKRTISTLKSEESTIQKQVSGIKKEVSTHEQSLDILKKEETNTNLKLAEAKKTEQELAKKIEDAKKAKPPDDTLQKEVNNLTQKLQALQQEKVNLEQEVLNKSKEMDTLKAGVDSSEASEKIEAKLNEELAITQRIVAKRREEIALSQRLEAKRKEELELTRKIEELKARK